MWRSMASRSELTRGSEGQYAGGRGVGQAVDDLAGEVELAVPVAEEVGFVEVAVLVDRRVGVAVEEAGRVAVVQFQVASGDHDAGFGQRGFGALHRGRGGGGPHGQVG